MVFPLLERFGGRLVLPGSGEFERARQVFNSAVARNPAAILFCQTESDVQVALRAARDSGRRVVVRSTGHSVSGRSTADDAFVLDLSAMRDVTHLGEDLFACQGGATWRDFDAVSSDLGLAVTGGTVSTTGVGGLTLGGGIGWLLPSAGLACDSLVGADVVLAGGEQKHVDDHNDPEFMRCLRGLGHGLAVITRLYFKAHPLGEIVGGSIIVDIGPDYRRICDRLCELMSSPPQSLMLSPSFLYRDDRPVMSIDFAFHGATSSELALMKPIETSADVVQSSVGVRPYLSMQSMLDTPSRRGLRSRWHHVYVQSMEPAQFETIADLMSRAPSPRSIIFLEHYHGAYLDPQFPSAFPGREARFSLLATASWPESAGDRANLDWLSRVEEAMRPWRSRHAAYLNYASQLEAVTWRRYDLELRRKLDPDGLFADPRPPRRDSDLRECAGE